MCSKLEPQESPGLLSVTSHLVAGPGPGLGDPSSSDPQGSGCNEATSHAVAMAQTAAIGVKTERTWREDEIVKSVVRCDHNRDVRVYDDTENFDEILTCLDTITIVSTKPQTHQWK